MQAVILAGGLGTRLSEETQSKPKPMVEIGPYPIIWHIMKLYSYFDVNEFIICCGYKGYLIKEYFSNYFLHSSNVTIDLHDNSIEVHVKKAEPWRITLIETGAETMTGGRLKKIAKYINGDNFCMTYGDGLSNVDIAKLIHFHENHKRLATVTGVQPPGRFGAINFNDNEVIGFQEKPKGDGGYINGGFFVLNRKVLNYISDDKTIWEREPIEKLSREKQLMLYKHDDFWHPMDTLRDKIFLDELWLQNKAPWRVWGA
jgi:glucose-1-phosphate cytidylyltransferase